MQDILTGFDYSPPPASRTKRWFASFIDYFIYTIVFLIGNAVFGERLMDAQGKTTWRTEDLTGIMIVVLPWLILFPAFEFFNGGQTIGKSLLQLKVVRDDFSQLNFKSALIRHLFDLVDYFPGFGILGLLVTTNNRYKQRIGDLVAKTVVIDSLYNPPIQHSH